MKDLILVLILMSIVIYNKEIPEEVFLEFVKEVRSKKTTENIPESFIKENLIKFLEQNAKLILKIANSDRKAIKKAVKYVRSRARPIFEIFQLESNESRLESIDDFFKKYGPINEKNIFEIKIEDIKPILASHKSTRERIDSYADFIRLIKKYSSNSNSIIDVSAGLNPIASVLLFKELNFDRFDYSNFSEKDKKINDHFLSNVGCFKSFSQVCDLTKTIPEVAKKNHDIAFLLKVLDVIETQKKNRTYEILKEINANLIVVSFSLKNISNMKMRLKNRPWFERMCKNLGYKFFKEQIEDELFYFVKKV